MHQQQVDPAQIFDFERASHSIETAILRASTAIFHEAYHVTVKTNRFARITSVQGLPLKLISGIRVPVVCEDRLVVNRFTGCVLAVHLDSKSRLQVPGSHEDAPFMEPCTLIILHRDLSRFCQGLMDGDILARGFSNDLQISITVAPIMEEMSRTRNRSSFEDFFSEKTQKALLEPLRAQLRGYKAVKIHGYVDDDLLRAVHDEISQERWSDPDSILKEFTIAKQDGSRLFKERKNEEACLRWDDAVVDIDKIHDSTSWANLVRRGGETFTSQLADLYFLMRLNVAYIQLMSAQNPQSVYLEVAPTMAERTLNLAAKSLAKGFWMVEYTYRPLIQHMAKLHYRYGIFYRWQANPARATLAFQHIDRALLLQPGDSAIIKEKSSIVAWMQRL
ncbi:hypothetical protein BKA66DRAFT_601376 [Pyrenochaeta sp. MPI-SDFR-AT-0127]|nr:hypothetical protein BKA66DRAFT_601376 [Pyrenochaeta sp. MPI-SDFR-AT-0127]